MLEVIRDKGQIVACLEWWLVNADGSFNSTGNFVWINQMEVSEINRTNTYSYVQEFIKRITDLAPQAQFGYFERRDKKNNKVRMYSRRRWLKLLGGGYEHSKVFTETAV